MARVRSRNIYEHVQGTTVRLIESGQLPSGCSNLVTNEGSTFPYPCTRPMTFIEARFEKRWVPQERDYQNVLKLIGYCRTHRPRIVTNGLMELPRDIEKEMNGPRSQKSRIKKMEAAQFTRVVPQGGVLGHLVERKQLKTEVGSQWVDVPIVTLCERKIRKGYIPTAKEMRESYDPCTKCDDAKVVVRDEV